MASRVLNDISKPHRLLGLCILLICSTFGSTSTHRWASSMSPHNVKSTLFKLRGGNSFSKKQRISSKFPRTTKTRDIKDESISNEHENEYSREKLYEAYNSLHTLGKDFNLNIQAPSVLVVGHQSSGKSALIEALMGFQFNNVGGGTKTRRPIALHMRYNPTCNEPMCYLKNDETGKETLLTLEEIQEYITAENLKLAADPNRCFDHREIVIRVEYRYCPNMVIVDTPGLISGGSNGKQNENVNRFQNNHEKAHEQMIKEAENLVLNKMKSNKEYIILCVEDTADWKHALTRSLVEKADPTLSRTVIVNTKLDTKLMQFSESKDISDFIQAPLLKQLHPQLAGGPFFTTVPSGRVGNLKNHEFNSNDAYLRGLKQCERNDQNLIESKMGSLQPNLQSSGEENSLISSLGVRKLKTFLEKKVERSYRSNVATIVPILQSSIKKTELAQIKVKKELEALSTDSLKQAANEYREKFSKSIADCIQGTIAVSPDLFGETLEEEELGGGSFFGNGFTSSMGIPTIDTMDMDHVPSRYIVDQKIAHATSKLYGGSQYHRSLREFALAVEHRALPDITQDEIANAAGMSDIHDGTNYMRAACVIAVAKAQDSFSPLLESLQGRARHIMKRLFPIVEHMLELKGMASNIDENSNSNENYSNSLSRAIQEVYNDFVEKSLSEVLKKCDDDLKGMTKFVTWDLQERGSLAVKDALPSSEMVHLYEMSMKNKQNQNQQDDSSFTNMNHGESRRKWRGFRGGGSASTGSGGGEAKTIVKDWESYGGLSTYEIEGGDNENDKSMNNNNERRSQTSLTQQMSNHEIIDIHGLMEQIACMRDGNRTTQVVSKLVQHIIKAWQLSFAQNVAMKFNCFYLLPFLDDFPIYLRSKLDNKYENELKHLFDLSDAKLNLEKQLLLLNEEMMINKNLQNKFESVNSQLSNNNMRSNQLGGMNKMNNNNNEFGGKRRRVIDMNSDSSNNHVYNQDIPVATTQESFTNEEEDNEEDFNNRIKTEIIKGKECESLLATEDDAGEWWMKDTDS